MVRFNSRTIWVQKLIFPDKVCLAPLRWSYLQPARVKVLRWSPNAHSLSLPSVGRRLVADPPHASLKGLLSMEHVRLLQIHSRNDRWRAKERTFFIFLIPTDIEWESIPAFCNAQKNTGHYVYVVQKITIITYLPSLKFLLNA